MIFTIIVHQLIKNSQLRPLLRTQTNSSFLTEIGKKVSYTAREEIQFYLV